MKKIMNRILSIILCFVMCVLFLHVTTEAKTSSTKTLYVGSSYIFKVNSKAKKIRWSSSDSKIATVNSKGKVSAKKPGKAVITAKYGKTVKKYTVRVNHKILKYISGEWYTVGGQPYPDKIVFTNGFRKWYDCDWNTGKYHYFGKDKVSYVKTDYGYYIQVYTKNGIGGYRLYIDKGDEKANSLECIGGGGPYSDDEYSISSSLERH